MLDQAFLWDVLFDNDAGRRLTNLVLDDDSVIRFRRILKTKHKALQYIKHKNHLNYYTIGLNASHRVK